MEDGGWRMEDGIVRAYPSSIFNLLSSIFHPLSSIFWCLPIRLGPAIDVERLLDRYQHDPQRAAMLDPQVALAVIAHNVPADDDILLDRQLLLADGASYKFRCHNKTPNLDKVSAKPFYFYNVGGERQRGCPLKPPFSSEL
jgi:hypothetical protein